MFTTGLAIPPRPQMPTKLDQARVERQLLRYRMLEHKFDEDASEFFEEAYGVENAATMGIPDTTLAPLPAQTHQLTTPGLYQAPPSVFWRNSRGGDPVRRVLDPQEGILAQAGYWTRMQSVMYYAVGIGVFGLNFGVTMDAAGNPRLVLRNVLPHNVFAVFHDSDPMTPIAIHELRLRMRTVPLGEDDRVHHLAWFWDVYDLTDPDNPVFRIQNAQDPRDKRDYRDTFMPGTPGYPWRTPEGAPYIPYNWYHAVDQGDFWHEYRPALLHGTLRSVANWTMTGQAALWSQGNHNLVGGVDPSAIPAFTQAGSANREQEIPIRTIRARPGTATFVPVEEEKQLQVLAMTPGVDLARMVDFSNTYGMNLAITDGISPSDATRRSANPTSGAALTISQADKRSFAGKATPVFRRADLHAIRLQAWLMSSATGVLHEADGYSVNYAEIPLTPTEQKDQREHLTWEQDQGVRSKVDVYLALHPGASREQAVDAIVEAAVDEARIADAIAKRLEEEGLSAPAAPAPPVPEEEGEEEQPDPQQTDDEEDTTSEAEEE